MDKLSENFNKNKESIKMEIKNIKKVRKKYTITEIKNTV